MHEEQQPWVQMKNNFLSQSGQLCYGYTMTKGPYLVGGSEIAQNYADVIYGWFLITHPVGTLFLFKSIWICPQGSQGWQKIGFFFSKIKLLSFWTNIVPKRHKLFDEKKCKKKKKNLFSESIFNLFHFWGNISAPNHKYHV